jgi:4-hydroxybenzoate polyprenyltransferase
VFFRSFFPWLFFLFVFLVGAISFGFLGVRVFWIFLRISRPVGFWCFPFPVYVFVLLGFGGVPLVCFFLAAKVGVSCCLVSFLAF